MPRNVFLKTQWRASERMDYQVSEWMRERINQWRIKWVYEWIKDIPVWCTNEWVESEQCCSIFSRTFVYVLSSSSRFSLSYLTMQRSQAGNCAIYNIEPRSNLNCVSWWLPFSCKKFVLWNRCLANQTFQANWIEFIDCVPQKKEWGEGAFLKRPIIYIRRIFMHLPN
jgi:hypothetical protein